MNKALLATLIVATFAILHVNAKIGNLKQQIALAESDGPAVSSSSSGNSNVASSSNSNDERSYTQYVPVSQSVSVHDPKSPAPTPEMFDDHSKSFPGDGLIVAASVSRSNVPPIFPLTKHKDGSVSDYKPFVRPTVSPHAPPTETIPAVQLTTPPTTETNAVTPNPTPSPADSSSFLESEGFLSNDAIAKLAFGEGTEGEVLSTTEHEWEADHKLRQNVDATRKDYHDMLDEIEKFTNRVRGDYLFNAPDAAL